MPLFTRDDQAVARERNPRLAQTLADEGIVSALRLPLFAPGRQVVGMLALYHHHERRYTDGDVRLAQAFTDQIAVALHNARLAANEREAQVAARRQLDRLSNLSRVTESLLSSTDIASVQRIAVSAAVALCSAEASALALVKPGQRKLVLSATHGSLEQWFSSFTETNLDEAYTAASITGEAIQTGVTVLASDYLARPVVSAAQVAATAAGIRSMIAAPLRKGDTILGVLWVAHRESGALTQEDALIIDALVEQVALALEQARLLEESHTLQVIAAELASTRETPAMIRAIVERTKSALAADGCALWLIEEEPARLALGAADGLSPWFWERVQQVLTEEAKTAESAHRSVMLMTEPEYSADDQRRARDASEALGEAIRRESVSSALRLPLFESGGTVVGMLALYHHHQRRYSEGELRLAQAFANQIAVALHNARLAEKEQAAQAEARRQLDRLTTITQITEQLLGATELSSVLRIVVESAGRLSGASGAMVGLVDDEGHRLTAVAADGEPKVFFQNFSGPTLDREYLTNTATGQAMTQCAPVVVEDYATWPTPHPVQEETVRSGVRAFVVAPMMVAGKPIGVLWVNDVRPRGFSAEDVTLVQALADQAALAIEHARLVQRGQDAAVLEERTRLARDLHDSVTQSVFSLGMMARAAQTQFARGNDRLGGTLDRIAELSQDALREMRSLLFELQPTGLAEEGLSGALRTLADAVRTRTQIDVTFEGDCSIRLAPEVETAAFRIMQEALANASKHAGATSIALTLEERRDRLVISVRDDGVGFDPAASSAAVADSRLGGMGMRTMQERAAACGLQLRIRSSLGAGTTVTVEAPLPVEMTAAL